MASVNKVILVGNLGADPEARSTAGGKAVTELRLATSDGRGEHATTEWHRIILWEKQAETAAKYLKKGSKIYVEGRIQTRTFEKDGVKKYITEIVGHSFQMLDAAPKGGGAKSESVSDDLPF